MWSIKQLLPAKLVLILAVSCTLVIVWASLARKVPSIQVNHGDKLGHALAYSALTVLWGLYAMNKTWVNTTFAVRIGRVALFSFSFGLLMEGLQYGLTTYRAFDLYDALANTSGVVIGVLLLIGVKRFYSAQS